MRSPGCHAFCAASLHLRPPQTQGRPGEKWVCASSCQYDQKDLHPGTRAAGTASFKCSAPPTEAWANSFHAWATRPRMVAAGTVA
ncbi:hypothetical protein DUNSADRAFT_13578 [Dunaliella salina]|uniref:Uncharacterized protein n=1 Tax=Dunaliella salina TaxID=3046 RepID=A0ABQ7H390_DUNSA|nr:hypothetical protein DUNSADRAFT_13578 [Dunaliella salina]|eukprot:KAF5841305.1 hypothetical protein DUNSADRAFT_13578 [Dunaliella salina]